MSRTVTFLRALTIGVRALTQDQAMHLLGFRDASNFRKWVAPLVGRDLVRRCRAFALPVPEMRGALYASAAGSALTGPAIAGVIRSARLRWAGLTATPVVCYLATRRAGQMYGVRSAGRLTTSLKVSHDFGVSEVLVRLALADPVHAENWRGEDFGDCRCGDRYADAVILGADGQPTKIVEIVGADYTPDKLTTIGRDCDRRGLSYEFW